MNWHDLTFAAEIGAGVLLIAYHLRLLAHIRREPRRTVIGRNRDARGQWVRQVVDGHADLLAVQSLRNWAMSSTFLASTAILIGLGIINFLISHDAIGAFGVTLNTANPAPITSVAGIKLLALASVFFAAFFCFAQTLRALNHLVFAIPVADATTRADVTALLNQGANYFTLGMRGFYLALPLSLWLFGAPYFLLAAALLVLVLSRLDYVAAAA